MIGVEVPIMADSVRPVGESNTGLVVSVMKFATMANYLGEQIRVVLTQQVTE